MMRFTLALTATSLASAIRLTAMELDQGSDWKTELKDLMAKAHDEENVDEIVFALFDAYKEQLD